MLNFLCIGAHKSGTSWLHSNLVNHPDVFLPPFKELHFFDQYEDGDSLPHLYRRINWASNELKAIAFNLKKEQKKECVDFTKLSWIKEYAFTPHEERTLSWYQDLFNNEYSQGKLTGEITPAYALLNIETYKIIKDLNPSIKLIFMMRNPIERTWSSFRFDKYTKKEQVLQQNLLKEFNFKEFCKYAEKKGTIARSDYLETILKIEKIFDKQNIHYIFFDSLENNPQGVMEEVCHFLQISDEKENFPNLKKKQLVSKQLSMPKDAYEFLRNQYKEKILELNKKIQLPERWIGMLEE